jgi:serine-type D-Ala-D-Ala carboxypeptidase/endopeptidase (penicillin-binding protein 4)
MNCKNYFVTLGIFLLCAVSAFGADNIAQHFNILAADTALADASVGISIFDITADSAIYLLSSDKLFMPASNLKLFTSAAALELLGPNYRFTTKFQILGSINKNGQLDGDLVIIGGGDPMISGRFRSSITEIPEFWADSLKVRGVKEIKGRVIVDDSFFKSPELGPGWSWDDLSYWYACPVSALSFNDNCVDLKFLPGKKVGDRAVIEPNPNTSYIKTHNNTYTISADSNFTLDYYRIPNSNDITFFGGIAVNDTIGHIDYVSVDRPEIYATTIFQDILRTKGIKIRGAIKSLSDFNESELSSYYKENKEPLFTWYSDSLFKIIKVINTNSQNFFAEQTLKMLGAEKGGEGSFKGGIGAASKFFDSMGITNNDLIMQDGSGLSYMNLVKPSAIVKLLKYMSGSPNFDRYYQSLGNPAKDKAVKNRLQNIPGRENVRAKTGYIANVSTISGYVKGSKTNHLIAFAIMINNYSCSTSYTISWQDSLISVLLKEY